jgi:capsular exopolysaccharide synthesis family protein
MTLAQLLEILFVRQRRLFIAVFLVAVAAAVAVTYSLPREYLATTTLFVGENRPVSTGANAVQLDEVLAKTYVSLLGTSSMKAQVVTEMPFRTTEHELTSKVSFEVIGSTHLIAVSATDRNPHRARTLANTYARTFVRSQQQAAAVASTGQLQSLNNQIGALALEADRLAGNPSPAAQSRREQALNELNALRASYSASQQNVSLQGNNIAVSSPATVPGTPSKPRRKLDIAVGVILALILATAAALLRNVFDKRVRNEDELTELLGVPVLARIPVVGSDETSQRRIKEAIQFLRTNLQHGVVSERGTVVAVTSAMPGEGKTTVTSELATSLGTMGLRAVAVDCDLRRPMLNQSFDVESSEGVTNVLVGALDVSSVIVPTSRPGVRIVPAGPVPPNPATILAGDGPAHLLEDLRREADYIVIDTPPVTAGAETSIVAAAADSVVLVVDLAVARRDALTAARDQLARTGAHVTGIVVNRAPVRSQLFGYYGYETEPVRDGNGTRRRSRQRSAS